MSEVSKYNCCAGDTAIGHYEDCKTGHNELIDKLTALKADVNEAKELIGEILKDHWCVTWDSWQERAQKFVGKP